jgi:hypothetical protein
MGSNLVKKGSSEQYVSMPFEVTLAAGVDAAASFMKGRGADLLKARVPALSAIVASQSRP